MIRRIGVGLVAIGGLPAAAAAQQPPAPVHSPAQAAPATEPADDAVSDEPDIVVRGQRDLPGAVIGDIPPEVQLGPADIRSYGVSSIADLLTELAPLTRSDRGSGGQPVVLLGGRRISSFNEIRDLPTEAIARVDILPEEVALKYGYPADQRVVNIVLRRRFRAITAELADRITTQGDRNQPQGDLDLLNINRDRRVNLHSTYQQSDALFESQRDLLPTIVDGADQAPYRTLLGSARTMSVNGSYARNIFGNVAATINARLEGDDGRSALGLGPDGVLAQRTDSVTGHLGTTLNGNAGTWRWSVTGNYDDTVDKTLTDTGSTDNFARSRARTAGIDAQTNGTLFRLPAGDVSTSVTVGGDTSDFTSRSVRGGIVQPGRVSRDSGSSRINLDVPLTSKAEGFGGAIGTLSVNVNGALERLSDFGTLRTSGYGANWSPIDGVRVIASVTNQDGAPTAQQLGNPLVVTPNVRLFDYVTGTTATVTTISGGNAALRGFDTHTAKLGLTLKPWSARDFTFTANYITSHVDDPAVGFPAATSAIAAAFPGRFTRDPASGELLRVDTRPVNFARTSRSELRYGFNLSIPLKSKIQRQVEAYRIGSGPNPFAGLNFPGQRRRDRDDAPSAPASTSDTPPGGAPPADGASPDGGGRGFGGGRGGGFGGGRGGGGFGGRGGGAGGRLQFALFHTWHFRDDVLIAADGPKLDLLDGDAIGSSGGQSRHEIEGQAGYSNNGLGARLSINWRSATRVDGGTPSTPQRLDFGSLGTANLRFFFDPTARLDLLRKHPWVRGMRLTFSIDNVFDTRQRVTDQTGMTPVNYQPNLLDPLGRTVRLSIRKLFF